MRSGVGMSMCETQDARVTDSGIGQGETDAHYVDEHFGASPS